MDDVLLVVSTAPSREEAEKIARALVEKRLAACVNIVGKAKSIYRWQGEVEEAEEYVLLIKSTAQAYPRLQEEVKKLHSYELPEIIAIPVANGLPGYLDWVRGETAGSAQPR